MAKSADGSGRIYTMVGLIATVVIPLAIIAPGLSRQVADQEPQRLGPVEPDDTDSADFHPQLPDQTRPVAAGGGDAPVFGQASGFGAPMMDPSPNAALVDQLPRYDAPAPTSSGPSDSSAGTPPTATTVRSQSDAARSGAAAVGLPVNATSKTVSHPAGKVNAPPLSTKKAPKVQ